MVLLTSVGNSGPRNTNTIAMTTFLPRWPATALWRFYLKCTLKIPEMLRCGGSSWNTGAARRTLDPRHHTHHPVRFPPRRALVARTMPRGRCAPRGPRCAPYRCAVLRIAARCSRLQHVRERSTRATLTTGPCPHHPRPAMCGPRERSCASH